MREDGAEALGKKRAGAGAVGVKPGGPGGGKKEDPEHKEKIESELRKMDSGSEAKVIPSDREEEF